MTNGKNLISIIVPVYKVEQYLDRCLESIVNQTYKNLEIIIVDDGSPDNCPQMCDEWAKKDNRITVIHKENDGLANARNSGIEICTGDYVMFTDSDDYIELDMVEFLLDLAIENDADVARCGFFVNPQDGDEYTEFSDFSKKLPNKDELIIDLTTSGLSGTAWNKLYKRDIIKSHLYDKADGCSEDIMHNFRVYKDGCKVVFCDVPKYHYVIREESTINTQQFGVGAFDIIRAKQKILDYAQDKPELLSFATKGFIKSAFIVLSGCIQHNAFTEQKVLLRKEMLKYKKTMLFSKLYSRTDKLKIIVLSISLRLYEQLLKRSK